MKHILFDIALFAFGALLWYLAGYRQGRRDGRREGRIEGREKGWREGSAILNALFGSHIVPLLISKGVTPAELNGALKGCGRPDCKACSEAARAQAPN